MAQIWNALATSKRNALLKEAGYSKHYASRCFDFLPSWVRTDIEYVYRLKVAA